jgi:hypothetical protein
MDIKKYLLIKLCNLLLLAISAIYHLALFIAPIYLWLEILLPALFKVIDFENTHILIMIPIVFIGIIITLGIIVLSFILWLFCDEVDEKIRELFDEIIHN